MEIITFSKIAEIFEVSSATISRWVKDGKLTQGPKAGKQKTVTKESVDALASNSAFKIGRESAKTNNNKRIATQIYAKQEELEELKERIEKLENLTENLTVEIKKMHKVTQSCDNNEFSKKGRQKTKKSD